MYIEFSNTCIYIYYYRLIIYIYNIQLDHIMCIMMHIISWNETRSHIIMMPKQGWSQSIGHPVYLITAVKACASHSKSFSRKSASRPPTAGTSWKNVVMGAQAQRDPADRWIFHAWSDHLVIIQRYSKPKRLNPSCLAGPQWNLQKWSPSS
jgi:hypothetical protein